MTPIEQLFENVEFEAIKPELIVKSGDLPYVTHQGELVLAGIPITVLQLSNGQRIIPEEEMAKIFGE